MAIKKLHELSRTSGWTVHDLRRTAATGMQKLGVKREVTEAVLNHVKPGIVGTYQLHEYDEEKRDALERWGCRVDQIVTGEEAKVIKMPKRSA
jgi:hypothetical protein